jgi:hypothetical protein
MPNKMSPQTKSFIILFIIALAGTYLCLVVLGLGGFGQNRPGGENVILYGQPNQQAVLAANSDDPDVMTANISAWKTFTSADYGFSFKYKPDWKVLPPQKKGDWTVIQVDPGKKYYNVKIYISPKDYYAMGGLPIHQETINGVPAQNVSNLLYGFSKNNFYYTFDIGLSLMLKPDFEAMVHSVMFQ